MIEEKYQILVDAAKNCFGNKEKILLISDCVVNYSDKNNSVIGNIIHL